MSKNTIIIGGIVVILIIVGIWYFSYYSNPGVPTPEETATTSVSSNTTGTPTATTATHQNTFQSIFTQKQASQCTYQQVGTLAQSSSVIDIADGEMYAEFRTTTGANTSANLMIYNGGSLYSWKEGATVGTKSSIKKLTDLPQVIPTDLTSGAIFGVSSDNVSWDCHDWIKDPKLFVIPAYVKFSAAS